MDTVTFLIDLFRVNFYNIFKLSTNEDMHYLHMHKILGSACLLHYTYRTWMLIAYKSMKFDTTWFTPAMIILHMSLNATSFIFKISNTRIRSAPMIYPEARLHSLIFAFRSLLCMVLMWIARRNEIVFPLYFRSLLVLLAMYFADKVTSSYKDQGTTMRAMPMPAYVTPYYSDMLNKFYAICQIFATSQIIFSYNMDGVFAIIFPIQISMFLMTLVRKSIISSAAWHYYYSLSLMTNFFLNIHTKMYNPIPWTGGYVVACTFFVTVVRFQFPWISKYLLWSIVGIIHLHAMLVLNIYVVTIE